MNHRILVSGHKPTFELFEFDSSHRTLRKTSTPTAPPSATWLERSPTVPRVVYASSETENAVYSLVVEEDQVRMTSKRGTGCTWPVHCESPSDRYRQGVIELTRQLSSLAMARRSSLAG